MWRIGSVLQKSTQLLSVMYNSADNLEIMNNAIDRIAEMKGFTEAYNSDIMQLQ